MSLWTIEHTLDMSSNVSINLYLRPCSIAIYARFYLYCLYHLRLLSGLQIVKLLPVDYVLHFGSGEIHKHCLYWSVFSTNINGKIFLNYLLLFKPFIWVESVNSTLFSDRLRNWGKVYIWGIIVLSFMGSSITTFQYFFRFFSSGL